MIQISQNTQSIQPSKIRKMFNKALEYEHVLSFTLGEPDFTASENVVEAGCRAIREGKTKYSANAGILELRQAIARYLHRAEGLSYDPASQIIVTAGAMEALFLALKVLLEPGDEVIVNEPCWTNYIQQISMCGGIPVPVAADPQKGFDLDVEKIAQAVTPRTRVIILNSPCNPTGAVASREALEQLAQAVKESEVYREYRRQSERVDNAGDMREKIDEYRVRNFELQNSVQTEDLLDKLDDFEREYEKFREDPLVEEFLDAELAFCRMMQEIGLYVTDQMHFE